MSESTPAAFEVDVNGATFAALEWNGGDRGVVLASHGFPDHALTYRYLGPALAEAGFRVVAPYLRGYAPTKSTSGPYHPLAIAHDLVGLLREVRKPNESAFLVGHDWGAAATYLAATALGDEIERMATLAVPHGSGFSEALITNPEQQRRSWYIFFFQLPLAEMAVTHDNFAFIDRLWSDWSPGYMPPVDHMRELKEIFSQPGGLTAALSYYRDTFQPPAVSNDLIEFSHQVNGKISAPCLYLHGKTDGCAGWEVATGMETGFSGELDMQLIDDVGHFLHLEDPELINNKIVDWFAG